MIEANNSGCFVLQFEDNAFLSLLGDDFLHEGEVAILILNIEKMLIFDIFDWELELMGGEIHDGLEGCEYFSEHGLWMWIIILIN